MIARLARWWLARAERKAATRAPVRTVECVCGEEVPYPDAHVVVSLPDDDAELGISGHTGMAADFCAEHCPGGCRRGCPSVATC